MATPTYTFRLSQHGLDLDPGGHHAQSWPSACRAATTANITISTALNNGDTLDGVTLATGDRVLVKDQSTASQNGIYIVGASPARADDYSSSGQIVGSVVVVSEGTANADTAWQCTTNAPITVGTTSLAYALFGGDVATHVADTTDAHDASAISFTPAGTIAATDVQAAIEEVASEAGSGVTLSDNTPIIEAGSGDAGIGGEASRDDHVHPEFGGGSDWDVEITKASDDSYTNTSIYADDTELFFSVGGANETWLIELLLIYSGDSTAADYKQGVRCTAGTMRAVGSLQNLSAADAIQSIGLNIAASNNSSSGGMGTDAVDGMRTALVRYLMVFSAACTFYIQGAQATQTSGKTAKTRIGTTLRAKRIL